MGSSGSGRSSSLGRSWFRRWCSPLPGWVLSVVGSGWSPGRPSCSEPSRDGRSWSGSCESPTSCSVESGASASLQCTASLQRSRWHRLLGPCWPIVRSSPRVDPHPTTDHQSALMACGTGWCWRNGSSWAMMCTWLTPRSASSSHPPFLSHGWRRARVVPSLVVMGSSAGTTLRHSLLVAVQLGCR